MIETDRGDDRNVSLGVVSVWAAVASARSIVPTSEPIEAELDFDDGRLYWEVTFRNDTEVEIDALSGAIVEIDD